MWSSVSSSQFCNTKLKYTLSSLSNFIIFTFFMIGFEGCNRKFHVNFQKKYHQYFFIIIKSDRSVWQIAVMLKFCLSSRKNKRVSSPFYFIIFSVKKVNLFLYILPKFRFLIQYNFFLSFQENSWKPGWSSMEVVHSWTHNSKKSWIERWMSSQICILDLPSSKISFLECVGWQSTFYI